MAKNAVNKKMRDVYIAVGLAVLLVISVAVFVLVQNKVGTPVFYDGDMQNVCVRINEI